MLKSKDQTGEHEHSDGDNDEDEPEVLVGLVKGVHEALENHKVTDHFEDSKNPHDSEKPNDFASLAFKLNRRRIAKLTNNFEVLETS